MPDEKDLQPWEEPGAVRRDCESHRGALLQQLAKASAWLAVAAPVFAFLPALVALHFGLVVVIMARSDLAKMELGRIDPTGETQTREASDLAMGGILLSVVSLTAIGVILFVIKPPLLFYFCS